MITPKYEEKFKKIIEFYKENHLDPWHAISENDVNDIYKKLTNEMDVNNDKSFFYLVNYIFKRISGKMDAHTYFDKISIIPLAYRFIDNKVFIDYPKKYKGYYIISVNGIDVNNILTELDDILIYGTPGKKDVEIEKAFMNRYSILSLPSLQNTDEIKFEIVNKDGEKRIIDTNALKDENELIKAYNEYNFKESKNFKYKIVDNTLILNIFSFQNKYKDLMINMLDSLDNEDLSSINKIILDVRGNHGGNGQLFSPYLYEFLDRFKNAEIITLIDKSVFSAARSFITTVKQKYKSINIGDEISTPLNVFGNNYPKLLEEDGNGYFCVSDHYIHPTLGYYIDKVGNDLGTEDNHIYDYDITYDKLKRERPEVFEFEIIIPDIKIIQSFEDYMIDYDTVLEYAIDYSKKSLKK